MEMNRTTRFNLQAQNFVTGLLLTAILVLIAYATNRYQIRWDWTAGGRHSLAEQSLAAVKGLGKEAVATVYAQEQGEQRLTAKELLEKYQVANPDLKIRFVDPDLDPAAARREEVAIYGTVVLRSGDKSEKITELTEEAITNGMIRLAKGESKGIGFVTGHGEHPLEGGDRAGLSQAVTLLKGEGYTVEELSLATSAEIPAKFAVLVVAGGSTALLPVEVERFTAWLEQGGRALIMSDPGTSSGLEPLLAGRGVGFKPGLVVDPVARIFGGGPTTPLVSSYDPAHPITQRMRSASFLPEARALELAADRKSGEGAPVELLKGADQGWVEVGDLSSGEVSFDEGSDTKGPLLLGVASTVGKSRLVVTGDSDFSADAYIGFAGNSELFMNMVRWLAEDENFIAIKPKPVQDSGLQLTQGGGLLLLWGLMVGVPLVLVGSGVAIWLRRKRR